MKFGHFDDLNKEYVIEKYETPLPWINYLGSDSFFTLLSNTAGGYAFYKDARLRRITRYRYNNLPLDQDGFHIYVKDGDTIWNPGWQPVQTALDHYECRHGLGYSVITGKKNNILVKQELYVPKYDNILLQRVTVNNTAIPLRKSICSHLWNSVCGMPWMIQQTSRETIQPVKLKLKEVLSTIKLNTEKEEITMPSSTQISLLTPLTLQETASWVFTDRQKPRQP